MVHIKSNFIVRVQILEDLSMEESCLFWTCQTASRAPVLPVRRSCWTPCAKTSVFSHCNGTGGGRSLVESLKMFKQFHALQANYCSRSGTELNQQRILTAVISPTISWIIFTRFPSVRRSAETGSMMSAVSARNSGLLNASIHARAVRQSFLLC